MHGAEEMAERRFDEIITLIPEEGSRAEMQLKILWEEILARF